jgi:glucose/arabinose dehydrogenase
MLRRVRRVLPVMIAAVAGLAACAAGRDGEGGSAEAKRARDRAGASSPAARDTRARRVALRRIGRFDAPLYVTAAPGDDRRLYVVEQGGRIMVLRGRRKLARPFLDIRGQVLSGGEQGMLSVAFAPDFATSRLLYVYFTGRDARQYIVEYRASSPERVQPGSARLVLAMDDPESNHNGGLLLFGPDGHMYVGTGDGGGGDDQHGPRGNAQDLGSLLGKILRIDPRDPDGAGPRRYSVPSDNPFAGRDGARGEIYSYGLRNPWRFSFDRRNQNLTIADVGQDLVEEIDIVGAGRGAGANFGWRPWEGRRRNFAEPAPGAVFPAITERHADGFCSITGGYVVRDRALRPLLGRYVYGDFCRPQIMSARLRPGRRTRGRAVPGLRVPSLSSFGQDNRGHVYATSLAGPVYRLVAR